MYIHRNIEMSSIIKTYGDLKDERYVIYRGDNFKIADTVFINYAKYLSF